MLRLGLMLALVAVAAAKRFEGQLVRVEGLPEETWAVIGADGILTPLGKGVVPPRKDKDGAEIVAGSRVIMYCASIDANGQCTYLTSADASVLAPAPAPSSAKTPLKMRPLVMILDLTSCNALYTPQVTPSSISTTYLGPNLDAQGGHAIKFEQCSYSTLTINATGFKALTVAPACTSALAACSIGDIQAAADTAAKAIIGTTAFSSYTHYTYVLPTSMDSVCGGWMGLALLGGPPNWVWIKSHSMAVDRWATVMQENLHTSMGRGDVCPNAPELYRMGWASPLANLSATDLSSAGSTRTYNLPATYLTATGNHLRIKPDWLAGYSTNPNAFKNLYLSVRAAKYADAALLTEFASTISIHEINATCDNAFPNLKTDDPILTFVSAIASGSQLDLPSYSMVVYGGAWVGTDIMRVHVCRYVSSASECPTLAALEARPSPPRPPSPLPPSPPKASPSPSPSPTSTSSKPATGKGRRMLRL
ncbi:hypothetical protein HYH03_017677 [Edaphochlamys debaryana]|uniref:Peptidase M11 gametolysin domain-containing protein n=1 Tax=Edaphochlamys debaryana TaxID=47281 RepID=A0A835XHK2_9CHLO|nr:hypothetical protein HYH03_017677 [Edaphochlamys debaryana]|eukprot:KAG2483495.1 hypothetical protein HYH03_017677 [Edaphochlamys debaryana]